MTPTMQGAVAAVWRRRNLLLFSADVLTIVLCFLVGYFLRFQYQSLSLRNVPVASIYDYIQGAFVFQAIWTLLIWYEGGYETRLMNRTSVVLRARSLIMCSIIALALMMATSFMYRGFLLSRQVYLMTAVGATVLMLGWRFILDHLDSYLSAHSVVVERVAVLGCSERAQRFANRIKELDSTSLVIGLLFWDEDSAHCNMGGDPPILGNVSAIDSLHESDHFDTLVLAGSNLEYGQYEQGSVRLMSIINFCESQGITVYECMDPSEIVTTRGEVGSFEGIPMAQLRDSATHPLYSVVKRGLDIVLAALAALLGLPIWLLIAGAVKATSRGPILFTQERAGLHGKPFRMLKFRSMVAGAEDDLADYVDIDTLDQPVFKLQNDPRVTRLGRLLRRLGLDEVPQLINVLLGQMSLVGPRPEEVRIVAQYDVLQRRRLKAKPGITGLQQVSNRGESSFSARMRYDLIYLKHQGLLLDVYILAKTVVVVLAGRGVTH